jgi:hypothetical protein
MDNYWTLPRILRKDAPKPKPRHQQVKCKHREAIIIDPVAGWKYCCLDCGMKTR